MVDYKYKDLFLDNSIPKQVTISFDNIVLGNEDLYNQEMTLEESLCSESELCFGSCEASVLKFKISDIFTPMMGKWIDAKMVVDGKTDESFSVGRYKVESDKLTSDRSYREIVAYDAMNDIINSSAVNWYNAILPEITSKVTMKQFRTSFVEYFGLEQEDTVLANDDMIVEKTIQVEESAETDSGAEQVSILKESSLSGKDVITAICEINGCFGHIGRDGKFHYIYLRPNIQGLYPSDNLFPDHAPGHLPQSKTGRLYPQAPKTNRIGKDKYIKCRPNNFITKFIDKLQIRQGENEIGKVWPEEDIKPGDNCYTIEDNFLVYGKSNEELSIIAKNIYEKIHEVVYQPFECDAIGNPCMEVGDPVRFTTRFEIVESYVLQRTLSGIQALRDALKADGVEKYPEKVNGVQSSIIQLKGKTNTLVRNVDETISEIYAFDENGERYSRIEQNANAIGLEVKRATDKEDELSSSIKLEADRITSEVAKREKGQKELSSRIEQTATSIDMSVANGEKTAGIHISLKNEKGEEIARDDGDIAMTGIVTFKNLTGEEGETKINGALLETGTVSCDTLNGGEINGQKIVGGEVNGATVKAKEGIYLQYRTNEIPPRPKEFVLADVSYDGSSISGGAASRINNPQGGCVMKGIVNGEKNESGNIVLKNAAMFPELAIINEARINGMQISYNMENSFLAESAEEGINKNDGHEAYIHVKVFGVFVCVYGKYNFREHKAKKYIDISVGNSGDEYIPEWANVPICTCHNGIPFVFILRTDGILRIINAGEKDVIATGENNITIGFRFDFIKT